MTAVGSLCSGYEGLGMGLEAAVGGTDLRWVSEFDQDASKVLAHRFPGVPNLGDLTAVDWSQVEPVDWLTAGYPCQPFSMAGQRKGTDDHRHIWLRVADAVRVLRPRNLLFENVSGHVSLGLDRVLADLASLGYVGRWGVLRAADAGAPHNRARLFIVAADADGLGLERSRSARRRRPRLTDDGLAPADTRSSGLERADGPWGFGDGNGVPTGQWGPYERAIARWERVIGRAAPRPTEPGRTGAERLSPRFVEWLMGLPDGHVTAVAGVSRNAQLKILGNGVVPQQAALALRMLGVVAVSA